MPNPYHDETGRFTSKEEMGAAVDRVYATISKAQNPVELAEATDAWFNLRVEYEAAQKAESALEAAHTFYRQPLAKRIGAPADALTPTPTIKAAYNESKGADEIWREEYAEARKDDFAHLNQHQVQTLAKLLKNRSAPQVLRDDFYKVAPPAVKEQIITEYLGHPLDDNRVSEELARGLLDNGGEGSNHLVSIALRSELPFEAKVLLAHRNDRLAYLAARAPHSFAAESHLERALLAELRRHGRGRKLGDEQIGGWAALALASRQHATLEEVRNNFSLFGNYDRKVMQELAQNPNLDADQQAQVLLRTAWHDSQHFGTFAGSIAGSTYKVKTAARKKQSQRLYGVVDRYSEIMSGANGADSSGYVDLTPSEVHSVRQDAERLGALQNPTAREKQRLEHYAAVIDAQDGEYAALKQQIAVNEEQLAKKYVEADYFANSRLERRLRAATAVRAADIAAGEYAERHYSA